MAVIGASARKGSPASQYRCKTWVGIGSVKINEQGKTSIVVGEEDFGLHIHEGILTEQIEIKHKRNEPFYFGPRCQTKYSPSSRLILEIAGEYGLRSRWRDTDKRPLESALGNFVENIQKHAVVKRERRLARKERERHWEEERRREFEESQRRSELEKQLENFVYCETLRKYANSLREGLTAATGRPPEGKAAEWISWIEHRADKFDVVKKFVRIHMPTASSSQEEQ
ncbi:MAG: hypothetical protein AAGU21_19385 [Solidesulfovibrio sp.]|uniref:hypothetical protein n=1 Tax=Solidesulfovibrio sp. TaxID=2910990 RepID=UPI002B21D96C|nr:hypothetical protein [Solidesulfovibrio sp.]MEA4855378.1 hypothetical protein [Solidesulfovibrio sp.]